MTATHWTLAYLTDFGLTDPYVAMMKAVALSTLTPRARAWTTLLDVTHGIGAQNVSEGAWVLTQVLPCLPPHTVVVAVVDPQVGEPDQRKLLVQRESYQQWFIGPDNGLLTPVLALEEPTPAWDIQHRRLYWNARRQPEPPISQTFHGRDVYSPVAAHLLNALMDNRLSGFLEQIGPPVDHPVQRPQPTAKRHEATRRIEGHIAHIDQFGNLITNIPLAWWPTSSKASTTTTVWLEGHALSPVPFVDSYQQGQHWLHAHKEGPRLVWVPGSHGCWELAQPGGSARQRLAATVRPNTPITLQWM